MSNMSYCRFENTLADLEDCAEALRDIEERDCHSLSREEASAALRLLDLVATLNELNELDCFMAILSAPAVQDDA